MDSLLTMARWGKNCYAKIFLSHKIAPMRMFRYFPPNKIFISHKNVFAKTVALPTPTRIHSKVHFSTTSNSRRKFLHENVPPKYNGAI